MTRPVPGGVTSGFGMRFHPILNYSRMHRGVDLRASYGTPIVAVVGRPGRAAPAGTAATAITVELNHGGGLETLYGHMSRIAVRAGRERPPRRGDRLCRLDRPFDRAAPPFRGPSQRRRGQSARRDLRQPRAAVGRASWPAFRDRLRGLLGTPVGANQREEQAGVRAGTHRTRRRQPSKLGTDFVRG